MFSHARLISEMSNTNENEESDQNVAESGGQSEQLVDAQVQLQASSNPIPQEMAMNGVENVKVDAPATASGENVEPEAMSECTQQQEDQNILHPVPVESKAQHLVKIESEQHAADMKAEVKDFSQTDTGIESVSVVGEKNADAVETVKNVKPEACEVTASKTCNNGDSTPMGHNEPAKPHPIPVDAIAGIENGVKGGTKVHEDHAATPVDKGDSNSKHSFLAVDYDGNESGTDAEQSAFMKELEIFFRERSMEFKPPKFYGEGLNCLK